jgi:hypothetical protein
MMHPVYPQILDRDVPVERLYDGVCISQIFLSYLDIRLLRCTQP